MSVQVLRSYSTSGTDVSFFSIDGTNMLVQFNQNSGADFGDWFSTGPIPCACRMHSARLEPCPTWGSSIERWT